MVLTDGGFNLGTAYGAVIIDVSGVQSAMNQARQAIENGFAGLGDRISAIGDSMSRLGGAISTFSAPIAAAGAVGLKAAADFDSLMKQIEIFGNVAPDQLDTVRQFALKMGADTTFSSADAAAAMLDLLKAGQSLDQAMQTLPEVLNLAAVGNMNLSRASGIVTSALAIFKLSATDASRVSNALARAANASQADVGDLGLALTNVGPIAQMFGLSVEDTSAILGVFANNGIKGSEAGTQLKSMLLNLSRPTKDVKDAFSRLGVSLYDAQGNSRNFNTVLKELDKALDALPVEEQNELMQTLGGSYGIVGLGALRAAGGIDEMLASMASAPEASKVAEEFMKTFQGNVESLKGSFETLMVNAMTPFMNDVLTPFVQRIVEVTNAISDWTVKNPELTKQIVKVLAVVAALGPALLVGGRSISAIGTVIGMVAKPLGLIGALLAGLGLAIKNNFLGLGDLLKPVIYAFETFVNAIMNGVPVGDALGKMLRSFLPPDVVDGITKAFDTIVVFVTDIVLPALEHLAIWFIQDALPAIVSYVQTVVIPGIQTLFTFLANAWSTIAPALGQIFDWFVTTALPAVVGFIQNTVIPAVQAFFQFLSDAWTVVGPALGQIFDWFVNTALPAIVGFVQNTVIPGIQKFIDILVKVWNDVSPFLTNLANWFISDVLPTVIDYIESVVIPGVQKFIDILSGIWGIVQPVLQSLYDWFITSGLPFIQEALDVIHDQFIQPFIDVLGGLWVVVDPALTALQEWFTTTGMPKITEFIDNAKKNFIDPLINVLKGLWDAVRPGVEGVFNWFRDVFSTVGQFIQPIIDFIQSVIDKAIQALDWLRQLGGGAPSQSSAEIVQKGLPANLQTGFTIAGTRDAGGPGMAGAAYQIGRGQLQNEVYIPGADGQFVAGFVDLMKGVAANVGGGGQPINIQVMMPEAALANPGAAAAMGKDFGRAIADEMQARGVKVGKF